MQLKLMQQIDVINAQVQKWGDESELSRFATVIPNEMTGIVTAAQLTIQE